MAWDDFGIYKLGSQTTQELHILNVYKDPEFIKDIEAIFPSNEPVKIYEYDYHSEPMIKQVGTLDMQFTSHAEFLQSLSTNMSSDEQKAQLLKFIDQAISRDDIISVAEKYSIKPNDVWFFLNGEAKYGRVHGKDNKPYHIVVGDKYADFTVRFSADITKDDFMQIWKEVNSRRKVMFQGKIPKNKLPVYDELLYAIFKARQRNESFVKIFDAYSKGKLPNYENGTRPISSEEKLKDYYFKYSPKPKN